MSWCDKLGSTPIVGFRFDNHFAPTDVLLDALSPVLDLEVDKDKAQFAVDLMPQKFAAGFTTHSGYNFHVDFQKVSVGFSHRVKAQRTSGGPPRMQMLSEPKPFTELLEIVGEHAISTVLLLPKISSRKVHRLGIITLSVVDQNEIPPGVEALLAYWRKPWKDVSAFSFQTTATLAENKEWTDRCLHTLTKLEEQDDELITVQFDWQRSFKVGKSSARSSLDEVFKKGKDAALEYFESLGEGGGYDASVVYGRTT